MRTAKIGSTIRITNFRVMDTTGDMTVKCSMYDDMLRGYKRQERNWRKVKQRSLIYFTKHNL